MVHHSEILKEAQEIISLIKDLRIMIHNSVENYHNEISILKKLEHVEVLTIDLNERIEKENKSSTNS